MPESHQVATQGNGEPTNHQPTSPITRAKQILRTAVTESRHLASADQRTRDDSARTALAREFVGDLARPGLTVAAYLSTTGEPDTLELISWLHSLNVQVMLPVLSTDGADLATDDSGRTAPHWAIYGGPDQLELGRHAILQPTTELLAPEALAGAHMIICPALAASTSGQRLGRGGGWYDRAFTFASDTAARVCLLHDNEVIDSIPTESTDLGVDVIITERRTIICDQLSPEASETEEP